MTRRGFLASAAAAGALRGAAPPVRRVDLFPAPYPTKGFFKFFAKPERPSVLVKVTLENGVAGWGQSVPVPTWSYETLESALSTLKLYLTPALLGRDPLDIAGAHDAMRKAISPSFSTGMPIAKAGVDLALHDIAGKLAGRSLPELWGRKPLERITLSWTVNVQSLADTEKSVSEGRAAGYRNFNMKIAPDPKFDVELCKRVRALAPDAFLWVDANGGYDLADALWVAPRLAEIGVDVFEQPVPANRLTGYRELRKQRALPILMDEGVVSSAELIEFIRLDLLDGVAMKPARTAGLWDARRQVEILHDAGLLFLGSGLTDPDVSLAASLQLYAAYGLRFPAALNGPQFLRGTFLTAPVEVNDGAAVVPAGPGLGVRVDETKLGEPA